MNPWRLAARLHDCDRLRALFASTQAGILRRDARLHCIAALDLYWTCGLEKAALELEAACGGPGLPAGHPLRRQCCALAELARQAAGLLVGAVTANGTVSVPLACSRMFPVTRASVNGLAADSFILDTGASTSVLTRSYCDRHGIPYLKDYPFPVTDSAGNEIEAYRALVDRIDFGDVAVGTAPSTGSSCRRKSRWPASSLRWRLSGESQSSWTCGLASSACIWGLGPRTGWRVSRCEPRR